MAISDITNVTNTSQTTSSAGTQPASQTMGKDDFLKLLTAQLKAQDPLNPMDSTAFTAQLAQFSSLEQLTNLNTQMANLLASQNSLQNTMATDLLGKKAMVAGNTVNLNGQADLHYSLGGNAAKVTLSVYDAGGALVRAVDLGAGAVGDNVFAWDGRDQSGNALPAGQYVFNVAAVDSTGQAVTATPLTTGTVTGVAFEDNTTYLSIDNGVKVKLSDIHEITGGA